MKVWLSAVAIAAASLSVAAHAQEAAHTPFGQGQIDRHRYEVWVHSLSGDYLSGATYWESHRSVPGSADCTSPAAPTSGQQWTEGCIAAQQRLNPSDQERHRSPEYRAGWNGTIPEEPPGAAPEAAPAVIVPDPSSDAAAAPTVKTPDAFPPPSATAPPPATVDSPAISPKPSSDGGGIALVAILVGLLLVGAGLGIYFLPTMIAFARRKRNAGAIFALNLFIGWTLLGWVLALVWSLTVDPERAA